MKRINSLQYLENADADNRFAKLELDTNFENEWAITLNGTDANGEFVRPQFVAIDNYNNDGVVTIQIDSIISSIAKFTKVIWQINPYANELRISATEGDVTVWVSEKKLPIGEGINESGASAVGSNVIRVNSRTGISALIASADMGAYLTETQGRAGLFVFRTGDYSAKVASDPRQGLYIAPDSDNTGASGAWVRTYDGPIQGAWFGIAADGVTADGPAVLACLTAVFALSGSDIFGYGVACPTIELPFGGNTVRMGTTTLDITKTIRLLGYSGGTFGGAATVLQWDANCIGIKIHGHNTYLDGLALKGGFVAGTTAEGEYHAIKGYAKFSYGQLYISKWQGDGIHCDISAGSGGDTEGNCNGIYGMNATINECRNGIFFSGSDVNAGRFSFLDLNYNRRAGVLDQSAFGNSYGGIQSAGNGVQGIAGIPFVTVYNNGHVFTVKSGQATGASTNSPPATATDNTWWLYWKDIGAATAAAPQWVNGISVREGGAMYVPLANASNNSTIDNFYIEADQPILQLGLQCMFKGGLNASTGGTTGTGHAPSTPYIHANSAVNGIDIGPKVYARTLEVPGISFFETTVNAENGAEFNAFTSFNTGKVARVGGNMNFAGAFHPGFICTNFATGLQECWIGSTDIQWMGADGNVHASIDTTGINHDTAFKVAGNKVVGARGAALPADATDLATVLTLANAIKARMKVTGGHGLVAD